MKLHVLSVAPGFVQLASLQTQASSPAPSTLPQAPSTPPSHLPLGLIAVVALVAVVLVLNRRTVKEVTRWLFGNRRPLIVTLLFILLFGLWLFQIHYYPRIGSWFAWERVWAVEKLSDQQALEKIVIADRATEVRYAAVKKLASQRVLAAVVRHEPDGIVRNQAHQQLKDPAFLALVAVGPQYFETGAPHERPLAANTLLHLLEQNEEVLLKAVDDHGDRELRQAAVTFMKARAACASACDAADGRSDLYAERRAHVVASTAIVCSLLSDLEFPSLKVKWERRSEHYGNPNFPYREYTTVVDGERITFSFMSGKVESSIVFETRFPEKIGGEAGHEWSRVPDLSYKAVLKRISEQSKDPDLCQLAATRLKAVETYEQANRK